MAKITHTTLIFLLFLGQTSCKPRQADFNKVNNKAGLIRQYKSVVIPLFSEFQDIDIPMEIHVLEQEITIDAGAAFGYVEVSKGLVNLPRKSIQLFALTHEIAHIATLAQARQFGLEGFVTDSPNTNKYQKSEYLADLIAIHLLKGRNPKLIDSLETHYEELSDILGEETFSHPSGKNRIKRIKSYIKATGTGKGNTIFESMFLAIWKGPCDDAVMR